MKSNIKRKKQVKAEKYMYELLDRIDYALDLCKYSDEIINVISEYGGYEVNVHPRGYDFKIPRGILFNDGVKRKIGRKIAQIDGVGRYAYRREYVYSNGMPATSSQLFQRSKKIEF